MADIIGDLVVQITGDYSQLTDDLNQAASAASSGADEIASSFNTAASSTDKMASAMEALESQINATGGDIKLNAQALLEYDSTLATAIPSVGTMSERLSALASDAQNATGIFADLGSASSDAGSSAEAASAQFSLFSQSEMESVASSKEFAIALASIPIADASGQLNLFHTNLTPIPPKVEEATKETLNWQAALSSMTQPLTEVEAGSKSLVDELLRFGGIALTLDGIKNAATSAFEAFEHLDAARDSLATLAGGADKAELSIEKLRVIAQDNALSFPVLLKAQTSMTAFGIEAAKIPQLLIAAGDAAVATGKSFESTSSAMTRMVEAGMAGNRQLVSLGLTTKDLATVMGVSEKEVTKLFKALDQADRVEVLQTALGKFKDIAKNTSDDMSADWQRLKNSAEFAFGAIGDAINPLGRQVATFASEEIKELGSVVTSIISVGKTFSELPEIVGNALAAIALIRFTNPMAALGLEIIQLGLAFRGLQDAENDVDAATKKADASFAGIAIREHQMFADFPDYTAKFNALLTSMTSGLISHDEYQIKVRELNDEFHKLHPVIQAITDVHKSFLDQVNALKAKLDAHLITTKEYEAAMKALVAETEHITKASKDHVLSLDDLITKNANLNRQLTLAESVYDQVTARVKAGSGEYNLQSEALKQLTKAHQALGDAETNVDTIVSVSIEKNADLTDKLTAQWQALTRLSDQYGAQNGITLEAEKAFDALSRQAGLTRIQFEDLVNESDATGQSLIDLVNDAAGTAAAFKDLGITSSAQLEQMAEKAHEAYLRISADANASSGEKYAALQKDIEQTQKFNDSLDGMAQAARDAGITSTQSLQDMADKIAAGLAHMRDVGTSSFGDLKRAADNLREAQWQVHLSVTGLEDDFKALGLTSSAELKHMADEAHIHLDRIRNDGNSTFGDVQAAIKKAQEADQKYLDSLRGTDEAQKQVGRSARQMGNDAVDAFQLMYLAITNTNAALHELGLITVADTSTVDGLYSSIQKVAGAAGDAGRAISSMGTPGGGGGGGGAGGGAGGFSMSRPSPIGGSAGPGGSFQLGNEPGQWTYTATPGGGATLTQNPPSVSIPYPGNRGGGSTGGAATGGGSTAVGGGSAASVGGSTAAGAGTAPLVPGMSDTDVAAFLAMGLTLDQIKTATVSGATGIPGTSQLPSTAPSAGMGEGGFAVPSALPFSSAPLAGVGETGFRTASTLPFFAPASAAAFSAPSLGGGGGASAFSAPSLGGGGGGTAFSAPSLTTAFGAREGGTPPQATSSYTPPAFPYAQGIPGTAPQFGMAEMQAAAPAVSGGPGDFLTGVKLGAAAATAPTTGSSGNRYAASTGEVSSSSGGGGSGPTIHMYVSVSTQSQADSLIHGIQSMGVTPGRV